MSRIRNVSINVKSISDKQENALDSEFDDKIIKRGVSNKAIKITFLSLLLVTALVLTVSIKTTNLYSDEMPDTPQDIGLKYDVLSSWVSWSNQIIWGSSTSHDTMHQAIGSPPDPQILDQVVLQEAIKRITTGCHPEFNADTIRVFDAGSGWGGTSFALQKGLKFDISTTTTPLTIKEPKTIMKQPIVYVDGVTLSRIQQETASHISVERGLGQFVNFHLKSFDEPSNHRYDLAVSIEAIVHSRNIDKTLSSISSLLQPNSITAISMGERHCAMSHFLIVEDMLMSQPSDLVSDKNIQLVGDYKQHWAGWTKSPFPLTKQEWESKLINHAHVKPESIEIVDLGSEYGLRLHSAFSLQISHWFLHMMHRAVEFFSFRSDTSSPTTFLESYLSTYIGAISREMLLVDGVIKYVLVSGSLLHGNNGNFLEP